MGDTEPSEKNGPALEPPNQTDEPSQNEAVTPQTDSAHGPRSSTKSCQHRSRHKRARSESPTPQPRRAPALDEGPSRQSRDSVSTFQSGANPFAEEDTGLRESDLVSEQRRLMNENAVTLNRLADPHKPSNRPQILTENAFLTHLPTHEGSPSEYTTSRRRSSGNDFGDWLPGHEQRRLMNENAAPLDRFANPRTPPNPPRILTENGLLTHLPTYADSSEKGTSHRLSPNVIFGDWLPGHGPQANNSQSPIPGSRQDDEDDGFVSPAQMLVRIQNLYAAAEKQALELWEIEMDLFM